jgi:hypothetical protein
VRRTRSGRAYSAATTVWFTVSDGVKEAIADPHQPCVLVHTRVEGDEELLARLCLFALLAPHLDVGGWDNTAYVGEAAGRGLLAAHKHGVPSGSRSIGRRPAVGKGATSRSMSSTVHEA